jgi:hypothetical protein
MVMSSLGLGTKNGYADECQGQFTQQYLISYSQNFLFVFLYCGLWVEVSAMGQSPVQGVLRIFCTIHNFRGYMNCSGPHNNLWRSKKKRRKALTMCHTCNALLPRGLLFVIENGQLRKEFHSNTCGTHVRLRHIHNYFIRLYSENYFEKRVFVITGKFTPND